MANPARRLADFFDKARVVPASKTTADHRKALDVDQAIRDYAWLLDAAARHEALGHDISYVESARRDWERMIHSAGSWDTSGNGRRESGSADSVAMLRAFAELLSQSQIFARPVEEAVAAMLAGLEAVERAVGDADLRADLRVLMLDAAARVRTALGDYPDVDLAEAVHGAAVLIGLMAMLAESGREDASAWRERAAGFAKGFFAGLAANAACGGLGFAVQRLLGG